MVIERDEKSELVDPVLDDVEIEEHEDHQIVETMKRIFSKFLNFYQNIIDPMNSMGVSAVGMDYYTPLFLIGMYFCLCCANFQLEFVCLLYLLAFQEAFTGIEGKDVVGVLFVP